MTHAEDTRHLVEHLLEAARADTAFVDLYLERARDLLAGELTERQYAALGELDTEIVNATSRIANAMETGEWAEVRQLTARVGDLKRTAALRAPLRTIAERVYGFDDVLVDPFSPGISGLAGVPQFELPSLRDSALKRLERLKADDPAAAELYQRRRAALAGLELSPSAAPTDREGRANPAALRELARKALSDGDLTRLEQLSAQIIEAEQATGAVTAAEVEGRVGLLAQDLARPFTAEVRDRAQAFGLDAHRVPSTTEQVRQRFRPAWRPTLGSEGRGNTVRLSLTIPGDAPEALRDTLELLMNRPFVTSAGTRYMPAFVAEDVLLESAPESAPGSDDASPLAAALGLPGRWANSRKEIERALRARGNAVVRTLGLDPLEYRIACIPIDVYTRLGARLGWGTHEVWTHFDGYMISKERKLMALVGGDVRFGGLHDLVAVGVEYDSDRLLARFAVVQRRRFATW